MAQKIKDAPHQTEALEASDHRDFFAYFMDPGTGKTRVELKDAWRSFEAGDIDALVVLAPNNVKDQWVKWDHMKENPLDDDQVTIHLGDHLPRIIKGMWQSNASGQTKKCWSEFEDAIAHRKKRFIILSVNYEALLSEQFFEFLKAFCKEFRTMLCADESTRIGKPGSKRTKRAITLSKLCLMRRILTGTPIVKSPMKIFSQAKFLGENALPFKSFYSFRNHFCIMGGFQGKQIIAYKNLDELGDLIAKWSFRKRKSECLNLPPQEYKKRRVEMTDEQVKAYKEMRQEFFTKVQGEDITAKIVLTQVMRLQQIAGGYATIDADHVIEIIPPARNPKLLEALRLIDDAPGQVVVWFRFMPELLGMKQLIDQVNKTRSRDREAGEPIKYIEFHGDVPQKDRGAIKAAFKRGQYDVLLGTESTGGIGINEFLVADTVIHVSSDFDTEKRIQADDRNHRMGSEMHERITYYDILVPGTVDVKIHQVLRTDTQLSSKILREEWRAWI